MSLLLVIRDNNNDNLRVISLLQNTLLSSTNLQHLHEYDILLNITIDTFVITEWQWEFTS